VAVKTKFTPTDFHQILTNYPLGTHKKSSPFERGAVQTNYLLETTTSKFAFRYYENRTFEYAAFEIEILNYLRHFHYPCPTPIADANGIFLKNWKNKPFAIFTFLEGTFVQNPDTRPIPEAIAKLHILGENFSPTRHQFRDTYDPSCCRKYALANAKKLTFAKANQRLDWLDKELATIKLPTDLPKGICHCDTHPSNFLHQNGQLSAVLDFDDASYIYLLYDIANLLYYWAWPPKGHFDFAKARTILQSYQNYRPLTDLEKWHLQDALKMVVCMSIAWFLHDPEKEFLAQQRQIEWLNAIGREKFAEQLCS